MGLISGTLVYVIIWWLVLFMVLPWGNRPPDVVEDGHASSAPERSSALAESGNHDGDCRGNLYDHLLSLQRRD